MPRQKNWKKAYINYLQKEFAIDTPIKTIETLFATSYAFDADRYYRDTSFVPYDDPTQIFDGYVGYYIRKPFWTNNEERSDLYEYFAQTPISFIEVVIVMAIMLDDGIYRAKDHAVGMWINEMLKNAGLSNYISYDLAEVKTKEITLHKTGPNGEGSLFNITGYDPRWNDRSLLDQMQKWKESHEYYDDGDGYTHSDIYGDWREGWYTYYPNSLQIGKIGVRYLADVYVDDLDNVPPELKVTWYDWKDAPNIFEFEARGLCYILPNTYDLRFKHLDPSENPDEYRRLYGDK